MRQSWDDESLTLILSLLLHVVAGLLYFSWIEKHSSDFSMPTPPLKTTLVSPRALERLQQQAARSVVETAPSTSQISNRPAHYLGERTQRVEKETVAPGFGSVRGGRKQGSSSGKTSQAGSQEKKILSSRWGLFSGAAASGDAGNDVERGELRELAHGSMDALHKDVVMGSQTLLNTDEYVYASFFNRVKAEVAPRWEPLIRGILHEQGRRIGAGTFSTEALFWIDTDGRLLRVEILHSSGESAFDEAAREALRRMPRMPNPPSSLRESDGTYKMQLGFMVFLEKGGSIRTEYIPDPRL